MLKKTIEFRDLDGNPLKEDFYFNLTKAELAEMELGKKGGMQAYLQQIVADEDGSQIIAAFKQILAKSYGKRSEDGRRFIKSDELTEEFLQTDAYSELFMELVTDAKSASEFINAIVPQGLAEKKTVDVELPKRLPGSALEKAGYMEENFPGELSAETPKDDLTLMSRAALIEQVRKARTDK